jgi:hypothetical protein
MYIAFGILQRHQWAHLTFRVAPWAHQYNMRSRLINTLLLAGCGRGRAGEWQPFSTVLLGAGAGTVLIARETVETVPAPQLPSPTKLKAGC